ncbi:class I SAM-dependent DNA methyltransferase [Natrialbaceae archaeon A-arb3/5]
MEAVIDIDSEMRQIVDTIDEDRRASLGMYEELAPVYEFLFAGGYDYDVQSDYVRKAAPNVSEFRLLEAGCGTGRLLERLSAAHPNAALDGIDLHEKMVEIARSRLDGDDTVTLEQRDFFDVADTYEVIVGFNLLPHFDAETLGLFFDRAAANLTDDGALVFDYKDPRNNENGLYDRWDATTDEFAITGRFITVYDDGQPHYAVSYEFEEIASGEQYYTAEVMPINFQTPDEIERQLRNTPFDDIEIHRGVGDQSGVVIARK